tara:strand:+ start:1127 stop:1609 length:483 start_codon:yes stop_codon:yes gene_type:complete
MENIFGIIGISIGTIATLFEVYDKVIPFLRRKFPQYLILEYDKYKQLDIFLIKEQVYKEKWHNMRTIMGLYTDIKYKLSVPELKVGCCPERILNLTEFYNIILLSNEWRKLSHSEFKPNQKMIENNKTCILKLQQNIHPNLLEDFSNYYWQMTKSTDVIL